MDVKKCEMEQRKGGGEKLELKEKGKRTREITRTD